MSPRLSGFSLTKLSNIFAKKKAATQKILNKPNKIKTFSHAFPLVLLSSYFLLFPLFLILKEEKGNIHTQLTKKVKFSRFRSDSALSLLYLYLHILGQIYRKFGIVKLPRHDGKLEIEGRLVNIESFPGTEFE